MSDCRQSLKLPTTVSGLAPAVVASAASPGPALLDRFVLLAGLLAMMAAASHSFAGPQTFGVDENGIFQPRAANPVKTEYFPIDPAGDLSGEDELVFRHCLRMLETYHLNFDPRGNPMGPTSAGSECWTVVELVAQPAVQAELKLSAATGQRLTAGAKRHYADNIPFLNSLLYHRMGVDSSAAIRHGIGAYEAAEQAILADLTDAQLQRARQIHAWCVLRSAGPVLLSWLYPDEVDFDRHVTSDPAFALQLEEIWREGLFRGAEVWKAASGRLIEGLLENVPESDRELARRLIPVPDAPVWPEVLAACLDEFHRKEFDDLMRILSRRDPAGFDELFETCRWFGEGLDGNLTHLAMDGRFERWRMLDHYFWTFALESSAFDLNGSFEYLYKGDPLSVAFVMDPTQKQREQIYWRLKERDRAMEELYTRENVTEEQVLDLDLAAYDDIFQRILTPAQKQLLQEFHRLAKLRSLGPALLIVLAEPARRDQSIEWARNQVRQLEQELLPIEQEMLERLIDAMPGDAPQQIRDLLGPRPAYLRPSMCQMQFNWLIRRRRNWSGEELSQLARLYVISKAEGYAEYEWRDGVRYLVREPWREKQPAEDTTDGGSQPPAVPDQGGAEASPPPASGGSGG